MTLGLAGGCAFQEPQATTILAAVCGGPELFGPVVWEDWGGGVEYAAVTVEMAGGQTLLHHLRFKPAATPLSVYIERPDGETSTPSGSVLLVDPKRVLKRSNAVAAVNATPYATERLRVGAEARLSGLSIGGGTVVSPPSRRLWSFYLTESAEFRLLRPGSPPPDRAVVGAGGFYPLVVDGIPRGRRGPREARTVIGADAQGYLHVVVVEGPRRGYSMGATTAELGEWLASLELLSALNLDGGGSSVLLRRRFVRGRPAARVVNRPRWGLIHGGSRPVANLLLIGERNIAR